MRDLSSIDSMRLEEVDSALADYENKVLTNSDDMVAEQMLHIRRAVLTSEEIDPLISEAQKGLFNEDISNILDDIARLTVKSHLRMREHFSKKGIEEPTYTTAVLSGFLTRVARGIWTLDSIWDHRDWISQGVYYKSFEPRWLGSKT